jgi:hypothetical protein
MTTFLNPYKHGEWRAQPIRCVGELVYAIRPEWANSGLKMQSMWQRRGVPQIMVPAAVLVESAGA